MLIHKHEGIYVNYPPIITQGTLELTLVGRDGRDRTVSVYIDLSGAYNFRVDEACELLEVSIDWILNQLNRTSLRDLIGSDRTNVFGVVELEEGKSFLVCDAAMLLLAWLVRFKHHEKEIDSLVALFYLITRGFQAIALSNLMQKRVKQTWQILRQ
ncbi:hypothetical protein B7486_46890 [cyanobacterium TDX16]|nr:hypothetical protein B7486_46890 [cyanobacterium TDX16]